MAVKLLFGKELAGKLCLPECPISIAISIRICHLNVDKIVVVSADQKKL